MLKITCASWEKVCLVLSATKAPRSFRDYRSPAHNIINEVSKSVKPAEAGQDAVELAEEGLK